MKDASKAGVIVIGLVVISEQVSCMVAEQEVKGLLCEDVRSAAIMAKKRQTAFSERRS